MIPTVMRDLTILFMSCDISGFKSSSHVLIALKGLEMKCNDMCIAVVTNVNVGRSFELSQHKTETSIRFILIQNRNVFWVGRWGIWYRSVCCLAERAQNGLYLCVVQISTSMVGSIAPSLDILLFAILQVSCKLKRLVR